jgi:hypothetical protein
VQARGELVKKKEEFIKIVALSDNPPFNNQHSHHLSHTTTTGLIIKQSCIVPKTKQQSPLQQVIKVNRKVDSEPVESRSNGQLASATLTLHSSGNPSK